ncbi:MAG: hypothetical protein MZV63_33910 [Marinilabiliales bacterium]|nr:hypothetical protein [Marinilabiliales bacterium]
MRTPRRRTASWATTPPPRPGLRRGRPEAGHRRSGEGDERAHPHRDRDVRAGDASGRDHQRARDEDARPRAGHAGPEEPEGAGHGRRQAADSPGGDVRGGHGPRRPLQAGVRSRGRHHRAGGHGTAPRNARGDGPDPRRRGSGGGGCDRGPRDGLCAGRGADHEGGGRAGSGDAGRIRDRGGGRAHGGRPAALRPLRGRRPDR